MILITVTIAAIVLLVLVGIIVTVLFEVDVIQLVASGILGVSGNSGVGAYRNMQADTPVRQAYVQQQLAPPAFGPPPRPGG